MHFPKANIVRIKKIESKVKRLKQQEYRSIKYVLKKQLKFNEISSYVIEYRTMFHAINHNLSILDYIENSLYV